MKTSELVDICLLILTGGEGGIVIGLGATIKESF
jgi:hypothetical protein